MRTFEVRTATGNPVTVQAQSHDDAVRKVAGKRYSDGRYRWISKSVQTKSAYYHQAAIAVRLKRNNPSN